MANFGADPLTCRHVWQTRWTGIGVFGRPDLPATWTRSRSCWRCGAMEQEEMP